MLMSALYFKRMNDECNECLITYECLYVSYAGNLNIIVHNLHLTVLNWYR